MRCQNSAKPTWIHDNLKVSAYSAWGKFPRTPFYAAIGTQWNIQCIFHNGLTANQVEYNNRDIYVFSYLYTYIARLYLWYIQDRSSLYLVCSSVTILTLIRIYKLYCALIREVAGSWGYPKHNKTLHQKFPNLASPLGGLVAVNEWLEETLKGILPRLWRVAIVIKAFFFFFFEVYTPSQPKAMRRVIKA